MPQWGSTDGATPHSDPHALNTEMHMLLRHVSSRLWEQLQCHISGSRSECVGQTQERVQLEAMRTCHPCVLYVQLASIKLGTKTGRFLGKRLFELGSILN